MQRIALLSDTHNYLDPKIFKYFETCDQIWHAGDAGTIGNGSAREFLPAVRVSHLDQYSDRGSEAAHTARNARVWLLSAPAP